MSRSLTHAVLNQAIGYVRGGNVRRARALGFSDDELRELRRMSATDVESLSLDGPEVCRVLVDHEMLLVAMRRLNQDQDREAKIDRCLELGASVQMMTRFFALTGNDCSTRRALLGLESRQGRLAMPADDVEHDAYRRWQNITRDPDDSSCIDDLDGMIALAEETDLSLGVVWHLVNEWAQTAEKQAKAAASRSSRSRFGERACAG